jgi:ubiquinone/menaquinone biosynthesis C-methylase UbiE
MGFYSRVIFPRLCDWMMNDPQIARLRGEALAGVAGDILEIGAGTGLNLAHYPPQVRKLTTVDPNPGMAQHRKRRIAASGIEVDHRQQSGENLPFDDARFDCVVSTWTLCSIPGAARALEEIHRVLKPGGRFIFVEHGKSDDPRIAAWQRRLNLIQRRIGDGCRLDVDVDALVRGQPFAEVQMERFLLEGTPRTHGTTYRGHAVK